MRDFLHKEAGFERVFCFTDDSEPIAGKSTEPFRTNLLRVMRQIFDQPFMGAGDNFWFFFSGHGIRHQNRDYLMPLDGDPEDVESTGISTHDITDRLRRCGADNVVLILDACRSQGRKAGEGIGRETEAEARRTGVISIFSCSPDQYSYELEKIKQGAFTHALLEGLGIQGRCSTVERLNQYLEQRVPELVRQHHTQARQTPYTIAEPLNRCHLILMPRHASLAEIAILKNDAYQAQIERDWDLAEQLWIRVLAAASGQEMDAIRALQRISVDKLQYPSAQPQNRTGSVSNEPTPQAKGSTKVFRFEVVTVNDQGKVTQRQEKTAQYFSEDLGNGISLEMVAIPGNTFQMGADEYDSEQPIHTVTIAPFFIGKYAVTQAQWKQVAAFPKVERDLNPDPANFKGAKRPVEKVSWEEAVEFCARLSRKIGKGYRLPSEAEWEYACRANTTTPFYFGSTITPELVNYNGNYPYGNAAKGKYREETTEVGSFPPNGFGLYDMHGNVWEWCADPWHENYQGAPPTDGNAWEKDGDSNSRLLRGGSWYNFAVFCRSAYRYWWRRDARYDSFGFRVVCSSPRTS